jgi:hypothetical protein
MSKTTKGTPKNNTSSTSITALNELLQTQFYKPDLQAVRIVQGVIQAHNLKIGDPAWLFVVAPPGSGKTTISIMGSAGLPGVISLGDFTPNSFLSGFHGAKEPGVLEKLGRTTQDDQTYTTVGDAVLMAKDFTTVLSMRREKRAEILGHLREIHDGQFTRTFGTGVTKIWKGRITVVAAVTPVLDRHYSMFSVLGERFLQVRWHRPDSEEAGEWAIRQQGNEDEIRERMRDEVAAIFQNATDTPPFLPEPMIGRIASLSEIVALGRTHIFRNNGNREIEYVPEPEANTRIAKGLAAIARGVASINRRRTVAEADLQDAFRVGLDSLTDCRRKLLQAIVVGSDVEEIRIPSTTRDRELESLSELGVVEDDSGTWSLTDRAQHLWKRAKVMF